MELLTLRTFDEVPSEEHRAVCIKVLKHCLKYYFKLNSNMYPQSCVVRKEDSFTNNITGDIFSLKLDIDRVIQSLPLKSRKIIILSYIMDIPKNKICSMLSFRFRVDLYRRLDEAFNLMYIELGPEWLRTKNYERTTK